MDTMEFDPKLEAPLRNKSANPSLEAERDVPFNSLESLDQEPSALVYKDDPDFRELLLRFQNAELEECLEKINQFLIVHPEDKYLLAFKQDVEVRLKLQKISQQQRAEEYRKQRQRWGLRALAIVALVLVILILFAWTSNKLTQNRLEQEAALTAQSLDAKFQTAESLMRAGKPEDALRLYNEIQQVDPSYKGIDLKIQSAGQIMAVEELYQQGMQAIKEGKSDKALEILLQVEESRPKYKDTPQLIEKIEQEQQIASLIKGIQSSYSQQDWAGVVHAYEAIEAIDPFIQLPELKNMLFTSYRYLIVEIAGSGDASLKDLETAERYYSNALALFPQNKEYAKEREELQKVAAKLLANKFYLQAIDLLESTNYSAEGLQESIRILTKANNIGSDSPAIQAEIEKAQLFLNSYNSLLQRKWDDAISGLERLHRKEENYAEGRVKYLLYEAYIARGDALFTYADFGGAFADYQEAEKFAWSDEENILRLFQIELRIAASLQKLGRAKDAAEFYHYAFELLGYPNRLTAPEEQDLLSTLDQAELAYKKGDDWEAVRLYEIAMAQKEKLYNYKTVAVIRGDTLVNIAFDYDCTIESLRAVNQFGEGLIISKNQEILVPVISTDK